MFAGLWYGSAKPDMTLFLKPLALSLKRLHDEGINHKLFVFSICNSDTYAYTHNYYTFNSLISLCIGIRISSPGQDTVVCRVALVCSTCDLPAKAMVLNIVQYNGFYGYCSCLQEGTFIYLTM